MKRLLILSNKIYKADTKEEQRYLYKYIIKFRHKTAKQFSHGGLFFNPLVHLHTTLKFHGADFYTICLIGQDW